MYTFEVEENIGLVVLEHLRHKLNIHVLDVDFLWSRVNTMIISMKAAQTYLETFVHDHNSFIEFLLYKQ